MKRFKALSVVFPAGYRITKGKKTLEIRSWTTDDIKAGEDLLLVENHHYLRKDGENDPNGRAVALIKIRKMRPYTESDITAACTQSWQPNLFAWEIYDVRPVDYERTVLADRRIYQVELDDDVVIGSCK